MIALALLLALAPTPRCEAIADATRQMIAARRGGVTEKDALQVADEELDGDARTLARVLVWYVYEANADERSPPSKVIEIVTRACLSSEPNALNGDPQ